MIFVGDDWADDHHDVVVMDEAGATLAYRRLPEGVEGVGLLHCLVAEHAQDPAQVAVGIETDRGLWVASLVAAGYQVYAVNPKVASRYRERQSNSGAKSDRADAKMLADLVRTDRHLHRQVAGDSEEVTAVQLLARSHQRLLWSRQRHVNGLRAQLREYYPAALAAFSEDLAHHDALAVLERAPRPEQGRALSLSALQATLRRGGRQRNLERRAQEIQQALRTPQLETPATVTRAYAAVGASTIAVIAEMTRQIKALEAELNESFESHPDADIITSLPGLGPILGARVLGEFGDDPNRYQDARSRRNYAGTAPLTRASGTKKVVLARFVRNRHLGDATYLWAFASLSSSPGARAYYDSLRAKGAGHNCALRALSNRLVGILHGCLAHREAYDETKAWGHRAGNAPDGAARAA